MFAAVVLVRGFDDDLIIELPFVAALIALAGIDLDHKLLPNKIVYPLAAWGVVAVLIATATTWSSTWSRARARSCSSSSRSSHTRAGWGWA